jgi:hypothetical protein
MARQRKGSQKVFVREESGNWRRAALKDLSEIHFSRVSAGSCRAELKTDDIIQLRAKRSKAIFKLNSISRGDPKVKTPVPNISVRQAAARVPPNAFAFDEHFNGQVEL